MRKLNSVLVVMTLSIAVLLNACGNKKEDVKEVDPGSLPISEFNMLMDHLEWTGDYINTRKTPTYITAKKLHGLLGSNIHIIDLRKMEDYKNGHIPGAVQVPLSELIDYLEQDIYPSKIEKVILVCYSGQESGFAASALRLLGYANFWNLKYGMSSWHQDFADKNWNKDMSSQYANELEKKANEKAEKGDYPVIETGKKCCIEMLEVRVNEIFNEGYEKAVITPEELFADPDKYYIINYWKEPHYNIAHIPGAIRYEPRESLKRTADLATLPTDKPIVVYCYTGQTASYITAFLRIIGYDAYNLKFGANGFMHEVVVQNDLPGWRPEKTNQFDYVTGEGPGGK